ncbi:MAG: hypothetical protein V1899_02940 [Planctomycetota bacterium]
MKEKTYTITVRMNWMSRLTDELTNWQIPPSRYTIKENVLTTTSTDVVDVATETFLRQPEVIKIEVTK